MQEVTEGVTWREMITIALSCQGETWEDVEYQVLGVDEYGDSIADFDAKFDPSWGLPNGCYFTIWTKDRVYFPAQYDGSEWCASVPRNPCEEVVRHIGG